MRSREDLLNLNPTSSKADARRCPLQHLYRVCAPIIPQVHSDDHTYVLKDGALPLFLVMPKLA